MLTGIVRFSVVALLFINPYLAMLISLIFDDIDSGVAYMAGYSWKKYTRYDKLQDFWWYIFILIYSIRTPILGVMLVLFIIRSIGQLLTIVSIRHEFLFWFPNIFENYFLLYLLTNLLAPGYLHYFSGSGIILPLVIAVATKMPQEYLLHRRGWFYDPSKWPRSITSLRLSIK